MGMQPLSEIDLPALAPKVPPLVIDIATALFCFGAMVVVRLVMQSVLPGVAPFALLFPFGLLATLLSSWRAGALSFYGGLLATWYFVLRPMGFGAADPLEQAQVLLVGVSGALTLFIAHIFKLSARRAAGERGAKLEERELMLRELNHRVMNNFSMVASLLQMQASRAPDETAKAALKSALNRVMSVSHAHRNLYASAGDMRRVDMSAYLDELSRNLAEALFLGDIVVLDCEAHPAWMDRDRAVAIGLIVNELVTNAAKHAFTEGTGGTIRVVFEPSETGWRLTVSDDGKGLPADYQTSRNGLGRGLVEAFARQAGGKLSLGEGPGSTFLLDMKP